MGALYTLWRATGVRIRVGILAVALTQGLVRIAVAFALESLVRQGARALAFGLATGAVWTLLSAARSALRHRVRTGLVRASAAALLFGEVSEAPREGETPHAILAAVFEGERVLADSLPMVLGEGLAALVLGAFAALRLPAAFVVALAGAAFVCVGFLLVLRRVIVRAQEDANRAQRGLFARWLEAKDGAIEIAAAGLEYVHLARIDAHAATWLRATARVELGASLLGRGPMAAVALGIGGMAWLRLSHGPEGLALTAFLAAAAAPLAALASGIGELLRGLGRSEPMIHRLRAPARKAAAHLHTDPARVLEGKNTRALEGKNIHAGYTDMAVLAGVEFVWTKGKPLVIEGPNGAGKTTLLRVMSGLLHANDGTLQWKDGVGVDAHVGAHVPVAFLPQRAHLAHESTVRDALQMLAPGALNAEMASVLLRVGLADRLQKDGLDTLVGTLSVGQRQRLALARILLVNAPIVVLDEPDANLDREGRMMIDAMIEDLSRERFLAVVAHGDLQRSTGAEVVNLERSQ